MSNLLKTNLPISNEFFLATLPFAFSNLGVRVMQINGNFVPEFYLFLWSIFAFIFCKDFRDFSLKILRSKRLIIILSVFTLFSLFALLSDNFTFFGFYGRYRALFWFLVAIVVGDFFIKNNKTKVFYDGLLILCLFSIIFSFVDLYLGLGGESIKQSIPIFSFSIAIVLLLNRELYIYALIISLLFILASFFSFWRQNYVVSLYVFILTLFYAIKSGFFYRGYKIYINKNILLIFMMPILGIFGVIYFWEKIVNFIFEDEQRYIQSVGKILSLFENIDQGGGTSEQLRVDQISFILNNFNYFLLPNGLIDDSILTLKSIWGGDLYDAGVSIVRDSIFAYSIVSFGLVVFGIIHCLFIFRAFNGYKRNINQYRLFFFFLIVPIFVVYFVDGLTMTQMQKSLYFGLALVLIFPSKYGNIKFS